jgi:hypothetical protein
LLWQLSYKPKPGYELTAKQADTLDAFRNHIAAAKRTLADLIASWRASHASARFVDADLYSGGGTELGEGAEEEAWTTLTVASHAESVFQAMSEHADTTLPTAGAAPRHHHQRLTRAARTLLRTNGDD